MNLKYNRKNYKSNLVEFSEASNAEAEEMKYIKIIFSNIYFSKIFLIFFVLRK